MNVSRRSFCTTLAAGLAMGMFAGTGAAFAADDKAAELKTVEQGKLIMGTNATFPPYEYYDGDKIVGIDADVAALIADKLGLELEIEDMDFGAIITAVQTGKIDMGLAGITVNDERKKNVSFTDTYASGVQVIIVPEDSPITSPDDLKGLKIRTPAITMYVDLFKLLGADPTSMSFSEVFTALQQGTIDGQENPWDTIRSGQIQEVQKYLSVWNYSYDPLVLSASSKLWNSLSDADKEIFSNAAIEACAAEVKASRAMDDECKQQFIDAGMEITELTPDQIQAFQDAVKPIYDQYTDD